MSGPYGAAAAFAGVDACIDPRADAGILRYSAASHRCQQCINIRLRCQTQAERGRAAASGAQAEGGLIIAAALLVTGHKTSHHAVTRADTVDDLAPGAADAVDRAVLIQQQRTVACHADQHIARALVLHHVGSSGNFLIIRQPDARDFAQLVVVRLDEERLVRCV